VCVYVCLCGVRVCLCLCLCVGACAYVHAAGVWKRIHTCACCVYANSCRMQVHTPVHTNTASIHFDTNTHNSHQDTQHAHKCTDAHKCTRHTPVDRLCCVCQTHKPLRPLCCVDKPVKSFRECGIPSGPKPYRGRARFFQKKINFLHCAQAKTYFFYAQFQGLSDAIIAF